mgnify:CR=1 FL=1
MRLYELTTELVKLSDDLATPEEQALAQAHWDSLQMAFEQKVETICKVIKEKEVEQEALDAEAKRLIGRARVAARSIDWLRNYLKVNMESAGIPKIKTTLFGVSLFDSAPRVVINAISEVPKDFVKTTITTVPDKDKISEHFKTTGEVLPGVSIEQGKSLRIS